MLSSGKSRKKLSSGWRDQQLQSQLPQQSQSPHESQQPSAQQSQQQPSQRLKRLRSHGRVPAPAQLATPAMQSLRAIYIDVPIREE